MKDEDIMVSLEKAYEMKKLKNTLVCTMCKFEGKAKTKRYGSLLGELFMWGTTGITFFLGFGLFFFWFITFFMFIFSLYYSLKRFGASTKICPECKHDSMISINSPKGQEMLKSKNKL